MASPFGIPAIKSFLLVMVAALLLAALFSLAESATAQSTRPADKPAQKQDQKQSDKPARTTSEKTDQKGDQAARSGRMSRYSGRQSGNRPKSSTWHIIRPAGRVTGIVTRRAPDAGVPDAAPPLGQIPSIAGGISPMNAAGFAPNAPIFEGLQPELPEAGPLPVGPGVGLGVGRGSGFGQCDEGDSEDRNGQPCDDDDDNDGTVKTGSFAPVGCKENDSGVTVWRGSCKGDD